MQVHLHPPSSTRGLPRAAGQPASHTLIPPVPMAIAWREVPIGNGVIKEEGFRAPWIGSLIPVGGGELPLPIVSSSHATETDW
jgi:hypothetical protein